MNEVHIHLLTNHFPIIGTLIAIGIVLYAFFANQKNIANTGFVVAIVMALLTIPTYLSGEGAEHAVEDLPGTSEYFLEEHEELGESAFWLMLATGLLTVIALVVNSMRPVMSKLWTGLVLFALIATFALMAYVGYLGGKIRHPEIRSAAPTVSVLPNYG